MNNNQDKPMTAEEIKAPSIWAYNDYNEYLDAYDKYKRSIPDLLPFGYDPHGLELVFGSSIIAKMAELNETNPREAQELHQAVETIKRLLPNL